MLKGIDPLLGPDILHLIASMGHGDELVIADANFPAAGLAKRLVRLDGADTTQALAAILTLFPLDQYREMPAAVMAVVDDPESTPDTYADFSLAIAKAGEKPLEPERIERFAFYQRAAKASGIIVTGERRLYGNIIIGKGIVAPDDPS